MTRHALVRNPFLSVTGPRQDRGPGTGCTPEITEPQARQLLDSIDCSRPVGLRDRAVIGTLTYTGARVGAMARMRVRDQGKPLLDEEGRPKLEWIERDRPLVKV